MHTPSHLCFSLRTNSLTNLKLISFTKRNSLTRTICDTRLLRRGCKNLNLFNFSINKVFSLPPLRFLASTRAMIKVSSARRISREGYSRLLITRRIEYSTRISSSTNTEYIGDGRRVRAVGSALSRLNASVDPRVCERDQTCFCSSGPCTVRVLLAAPLIRRRRGGTTARKREA